MHAGREVVESNLDRKPGLTRGERIGGGEHLLERLAGDLILRALVVAGLVAHRAGVVHHDRDGCAEAFVTGRYVFGVRSRGGGASRRRVIMGCGRPPVPVPRDDENEQHQNQYDSGWASAWSGAKVDRTA